MSIANIIKRGQDLPCALMQLVWCIFVWGLPGSYVQLCSGISTPFKSKGCLSILAFNSHACLCPAIILRLKAFMLCLPLFRPISKTENRTHWKYHLELRCIGLSWQPKCDGRPAAFTIFGTRKRLVPSYRGTANRGPPSGESFREGRARQQTK